MRVIEILCSHPHCTRKDAHSQICDGGECAGCQPWPAADGLRLCQHHADRFAGDLDAIPGLWSALDEAKTGGSGNDQPSVSGGEVDPGINVSPAILDCQTEIRAVLVSWTLLVANERGFTTPADDIPSIAAWLARSATWLAAQPYAADAATETSDLTHRAHALAYPGRRPARAPVGPCPEGCPGIVHATLRHPDDRHPSDLICDTDDTHAWAFDPEVLYRIRDLIATPSPPVLVDSAALAVALGVTGRRIRYLVARKILTPAPARIAVAHTGRPRLLFDLALARVALAACPT